MRTHPHTEIDPALAETVSRLYLGPIDPERARRDVATIAEAARQADLNRGPAVSAGAPSSLARRRRMPLWRPVAAAAAALVAIPGGLAAAGVQLPEAVDASYRAVGVTLPNQDEQARDAQPASTPRERRDETPAATTPSRTSPSVTSPSDAARARTERQERKERAERARRAQRRSQGRGDEQRATPATPATPAEPGGRGDGATPATPARPAQPARPQERSAVTPETLGPQAEDVPRRTLPRVTGQGKGKGLQRINRE